MEIVEDYLLLIELLHQSNRYGNIRIPVRMNGSITF